MRGTLDPMNIAFFTDTFYPQVNGVATSVASFAKELGSRGHRVLIVTPMAAKKIRGAEWSSPGVEVLRLPSLPSIVYPDFRVSPFMGIPKEIKALKAFKPDVIHFHTTLSVSIDAVIAAKLLKVPLIGTNHIYLTSKDTEYLTFVASSESIRKVLTTFVLNYSLAFYAVCDERIAPSKMLIQALRRTGYTRSIAHIPNPVPPACLATVSAETIQARRTEYHLEGKTIVHVGRLSFEKNIDGVLRVFQRVLETEPSATLLLIGDGPDRKRLEGIARDLGIADRVVWTGFIDHDRLMSSGLLAACEIFITASPMESQGMVVVEAMAFGLPIVAVREAAIPEVVGNAGKLHALEDIEGMATSILHILRSPETAQKLSIASRTRAEAFSPVTLTNRLIDLYERSKKEHGHKHTRKRRTKK